MNEFVNMTNKEIRKRAWELCRANFWKILGGTFLISLISTVTMELALWTESSIFASLGLLAVMVLSVIMSLGMIRFILDIWHGESTSLSVLFSQKHRFWTNLGAGLLLTLIFFGLLLAAALISLLAISVSETLGAIITVVVIIAAVVLVIWMSLRFELIATCIVLNHSMGPIGCMRTSWRASKGNLKRLFCNGFVLNLPLIVAEILLSSFQYGYLYMSGLTLNPFGSLLLRIASTLLTALLSGYIYLGTYALHEQLLENYTCSHAAQSAAEMRNEPAPTIELPASDAEYQEADEYEDDDEYEDEEEEN